MPKYSRPPSKSKKSLELDTFSFSNIKLPEDSDSDDYHEFTSRPSHGKIKRKPSLKKLLNDAERKRDKIHTLMNSGQREEALKIKKDSKWRSAMDKAAGVKIKDNPQLIKRSIKKMKKRKERSSKKWNDRKEATEKRIDFKQKKRTMNIKKRIDGKKDRKIKRLKKKGRII